MNASSVSDPAAPSSGGTCLCGCGQRTSPAKRNHLKAGVRKGDPMRFCPGHGGAKFKALPFSEQDIAEMVRLYVEEHMPSPEIARRFGCLPGSVSNRLRKLGVSNGHRPRRVEPRVDPHSGYVFAGGRRLHRQVAEVKLGRPLLPGEVVHHKNGDRLDNSPDNLKVLSSQSEHMREHGPEWETWTAEEDARLLGLMRQDYSIGAIAHHFGFSVSRVGNRIRRLKRRGVIAGRRRAGRKRDRALEHREKGVFHG